MVTISWPVLLQYMDPLFYLVGKIVIGLGILMLIGSITGALLIVYSFKTKRFFFARLMLTIISILESVIKSIFRLVGSEDTIVDEVGVLLRNYISQKKFEETSISSRTIFMPQCLRNPECPAKLTQEGIICVNCGRCEIGNSKRYAEEMGYKFFLVPGSSFIKRMIKKYPPKAIIGVGCQMEIKEGLDLCNRYAIPGIGVPLSTTGCVSTTLDWNLFYEAISNGTGPKTAKTDEVSKKTDGPQDDLQGPVLGEQGATSQAHT